MSGRFFSELTKVTGKFAFQMPDNIGLFLVNDPLRHRTPYLEGPGCAVNEFG